MVITINLALISWLRWNVSDTDTSEMIGLKLYVGNSLPWGFLLLNLITMCFSLLLSCHFPGSLCGNRKFQQMSLFFLWTVVLGRILTVDNLWWAFSLFGGTLGVKGLLANWMGKSSGHKTVVIWGMIPVLPHVGYLE